MWQCVPTRDQPFGISTANVDISSRDEPSNPSPSYAGLPIRYPSVVSSISVMCSILPRPRPIRSLGPGNGSFYQHPAPLPEITITCYLVETTGFAVHHPLALHNSSTSREFLYSKPGLFIYQFDPLHTPASCNRIRLSRYATWFFWGRLGIRYRESPRRRAKKLSLRR